MYWYVALVLLTHVRAILPSCIADAEVVVCKNVTQEDYPYEIHRAIAERATITYHAVHITMSDFEVIEHMVCTKWCLERTLRINHCNVKTIGSRAFDDFDNLEVLDLSHNRLKSVDVAALMHKRRMNHLDFSHNLLTSLELPGDCSYKDRSFNFGFNYINNITFDKWCDNTVLNLEHNSNWILEPTEEVALQLDISRVRIRKVNLSNSTNDFQKIITTFDAADLDVSNNQFEYLDADFCLQTNCFLNARTVHLRGSSINDLSKTIFKYVEMDMLDLSDNPLSAVREPKFEDSTIWTLDMSHSHLSFVDTLFYRCRCSNLILRNTSIAKLDSNSFQGIQNVMSIDLSFNELELRNGSFSRCASLGSLDLSHSKLSLIESDALVGLTKLTELNLKNTSLTSLPTVLLRPLTNLNRLILSDNNLKELKFTEYVSVYVLELTLNGDVKRNMFSKLLHLRELIFTNSIINRIEEGAFRGLFNLEDLKFYNTSVGVVDPGAFEGLFNLRRQNFNQIMSKSVNAHAFEDLSSLQEMDLTDASLSHIEPFAFSGLIGLETLTLARNDLTDLDDNALSGLHNLAQFDLSGNKLQNLSDFKFKDLRMLTNLSLNDCQLTGISQNAFYGLKSLKSLSLRRNVLLDLEVGSLRHFPDLLTLDLSGNRIGDPKIGVFSNLRNLLELNLASNNISKFSMESFAPLRSLLSLRLDDNHLKTIDHENLVRYASDLKNLSIANNKWKCEDLTVMLATFRRKGVDYLSDTPDYIDDNVEGIRCIDVCKFLLCLKDSHGIN